MTDYESASVGALEETERLVDMFERDKARHMDYMHMSFEQDVRRAKIRQVFKWTTIAIVAIVVAFLLLGCRGSVEANGTADNPNKTPGLPLDAHSVTEYNKPEWLRYCSHCYKVTDRSTGQSWWLLVMHEDTSNESYVALPILGGVE